MSYADKPPYICKPVDQSQGRPATFIFLHGYGDDAQGLPLGIAQKFQTYNKLPYIRWLLPNAPYNHQAHDRAWYLPKALPSPAKPRIPGHDLDDDNEDNDDAGHDTSNKDDEQGIMKTVDTIDELIRAEIERGVLPERIIVGGFSQGCATSLVWGLTSALRDVVAGIVCASGYFPLEKRILYLQRERVIVRGREIQQQHQHEDEKKDEKELHQAQVQEQTSNRQKQWLLLHGSSDMLVSNHLFRHLSTQLSKHLNINSNLDINTSTDANNIKVVTKSVDDNDDVSKHESDKHNSKDKEYEQNPNIEGHVYDGMGHSFCNEELRDILHWVERVVPP